MALFRGVRDYLPITISQGIPTNSPVPQTVGFGDFNGDSKTDMAVVDLANNSVTIYLNNGDGTFKESANYSTGASGAGIGVGDLNGDGKQDLVVGLNSNCGNNVGLCNGKIKSALMAQRQQPHKRNRMSEVKACWRGEKRSEGRT